MYVQHTLVQDLNETWVPSILLILLEGVAWPTGFHLLRLEPRPARLVQAPPAGTAGGDYQPPTQAGQKTSFTDKAKAFAVKAIDHTQTALEGAKQKVTKQATAPAQGGQAGAPGTTSASQ